MNQNTTPTTIKILLVSPQAKTRTALREFLASSEGLSIVAEAGSPDETLRKLKSNKADVVIVVNDLPGVELTKTIRQSDSTVRVIIVTATNSPEDIFLALDAGADGYVLSGNTTGLEMAVRSVRLGTVWLDPGIAKQVMDSMVSASSMSNSGSQRVLPTGVLRLPLLPQENDLLNAVAASNCVDGVCMVDPSFVKKLRRYGPNA